MLPTTTAPVSSPRQTDRRSTLRHAARRSHWVSFTLALWLAMAVTTSAEVAMAEPTEDEEQQGRDLALEAMDHYKAAEKADDKVDEYSQALTLFEQARAVYPSGQVLRMIGYTLMGLGRWMEAADVLDEAIATTYKPLVPRDVEDAQDNLDQVLKHLIVIEVIASVDGTRVSIDGGDPVKVPHKQRLLPGSHELVVTAEGHAPTTKKVDVAVGESVQYKLNPVKLVAKPRPGPKPAPEPEPEPETPSSAFGWFPGQGVVGLAAGGLGLVAGIVGIGVGGYGTSLRGAVQDNINAHHTNYDANCSRNGDLCQTDIALINRDGQRAHDYQTAGLALGLTGAALFAVGTTLFLLSDMSPLAPNDEARSGVTARCAVTLGGVGCSGAF